MEYIFLSILAFSFGFFQKIADGHNEHGLNWFKGAGIFFGIVCGIIGLYIVMYSSVLLATYSAILLYWIYKLKIDYINHAIALIIMLFGIFLSKNIFLFYHVLFMLIAYVIMDFIKHNLQISFLKVFYKYRLQFIIIPIIYSLIINDINGSVIIFNLVGVSMANYIFKINK